MHKSRSARKRCGELKHMASAVDESGMRTKKRNANWSLDEENCLSTIVHELDAKFGTSGKRSYKVWQRIAHEMNRRCPGRVRSMEETKKKWENMKARAKRMLGLRDDSMEPGPRGTAATKMQSEPEYSGNAPQQHATEILLLTQPVEEKTADLHNYIRSNNSVDSFELSEEQTDDHGEARERRQMESGTSMQVGDTDAQDDFAPPSAKRQYYQLDDGMLALSKQKLKEEIAKLRSENEKMVIEREILQIQRDKAELERELLRIQVARAKQRH